VKETALKKPKIPVSLKAKTSSQSKKSLTLGERWSLCTHVREKLTDYSDNTVYEVCHPCGISRRVK
jgi:hypothetical protein